MAEQDKTDASNPSSDDAKTRKTPDPKSSDQAPKEAAQQTQNGAGKEQDAITLLKADHRAVEALFTQFENASRSGEKLSLARQISQELIIHTIIEEEIFYPACRKHVDDKLLNEAQVEHDSAKTLINELLSGSPDQDGFFDAKVKVLSEQIKHHVEEEEKRAEGIFAKAKAAGLDVEGLGRQIAARKAELKQQAENDDLARPRARSFRALAEINKENDMAQSSYRDRDSQGRFTSDDDDDRRTSSRGRAGDNGRYARSDDDDDRGSRGRTPDRDDRGRFVSDDDHDDRRSSRSSRSSYSRSRDDDYDDRGRTSYAGNTGSYGRSRDDDDDRRGSSRSNSRGGDYGRSSERDDDRRSSQASRSDDGRRTGGWFGDSEGHSDASRRGWQNSDHGDSGWYGDSQGHSEASRRGWENREGARGRSRYDDDDRRSSRSRDDDDDRGSSRSSSRGAYSRSRDDDDDRRGGERSNSGRSGNRSDQGRGGWFGDSEGHSEASRRGWENRR